MTLIRKRNQRLPLRAVGKSTIRDDGELIDLIDFAYAAALDGDLWPTVLAKLAEATGTMQSIIATMDGRTNSFDSVSRRTIAELDASYNNYWAYHNPLWAKCSALPPGKVFSFESLMAPQDFAETPIFNEWWKLADYGLAMLGVNLIVENQVSSLICVITAPAGAQSRIFELAVRHMRVPYASTASSGGLVLKGGCLATTDGSDTLKRLIASCAHAAGPAWAIRRRTRDAA